MHATILYTLRQSNLCLIRRDFIKFNKIQPYMQARLYADSLSRTLKSTINEILELDENVSAHSNMLENRKTLIIYLK